MILWPALFINIRCRRMYTYGIFPLTHCLRNKSLSRPTLMCHSLFPGLYHAISGGKKEHVTSLLKGWCRVRTTRPDGEEVSLERLVPATYEIRDLLQKYEATNEFIMTMLGGRHFEMDGKYAIDEESIDVLLAACYSWRQVKTRSIDCFHTRILSTTPSCSLFPDFWMAECITFQSMCQFSIE